MLLLQTEGNVFRDFAHIQGYGVASLAVTCSVCLCKIISSKYAFDEMSVRYPDVSYRMAYYIVLLHAITKYVIKEDKFQIFQSWK